jgi:hypothetical protein
MALCCKLSAEGAAEEKIKTIGTTVPPKTIKENYFFSVFICRNLTRGYFVST